jgi:ketosteroid isomerase-like protein
MKIEPIANRLVELCRRESSNKRKRNFMPRMPPASSRRDCRPAPGDATGLAAIREKGRQFQAAIEAVHGVSVSEPVVAGNWFSVAMTLDVTYKGRGRTKLDEICLFRVRDGKIVREQFFYDVG